MNARTSSPSFLKRILSVALAFAGCLSAAYAQTAITGMRVGAVSYTGSEQTPALRVSPTGATFTYAVVGGTTSTTATNVGTYTINWSGTGAYSGSGTLSWTIAANAKPAAWWQLEGNYSDSGGSGISVGAGGAATLNTENAKRGKGLTVPGTMGQGMGAPANSFTNISGTALSFALWVKPTDSTGYCTALRKGTDGGSLTGVGPSPWAVYGVMTSSGVPMAHVATGGGVATYVGGSATLPLNTWSHLAATYDGSLLKLYVNGSQVGSSPCSGTLDTSTGAVLLGSDGWSNLWKGQLDEAMIWGRVLAPAEIATLASGNPIPTAITWAQPANIMYGTTLTGILNASVRASMWSDYTPAGTITYAANGSAVTGTSVLAVGTHTLVATFNPSDTVHFASSTATVQLTVQPNTQGAPTTISSSVHPRFPVGNSATLTLSGGGAQGNGQIQYSADNGATWGNVSMATATTAVFTPAVAGTYEFRGQWGGNTTYQASATSATLLTVTVVPAPFSTNDTYLADLFPYTQGGNGTRLQYRRGSTYTDFSYDASDAASPAWGNAAGVGKLTKAEAVAGFVQLHPVWMDGGGAQVLDAAVMVVTVPTAGTYQITGTVASIDTGSGANGIIARILRGQAGATVWTVTLAPQTNTAVSASVTLGANDKLCFEVDANGNASYDASRWTDVRITKQVSINWAPASPIVYGQVLSESQLNATASVPGAFDYGQPIGTILNAGTQTLTAQFTPTDTAYPSINTQASLVVDKAPLTITADSHARPWGAANPALTYTIAGWVNGETQASGSSGAPSITTAATTSSAVGTYPITAAVGTFAASNYALAYVGGTLTVTQASQNPPASIATSMGDIVTVTVSGGGAGSGGPQASLHWSANGGDTWSSAGLTAGALSGSFGTTSQTFTWVPPAAGTYHLRASWQGNTNVTASSVYTTPTAVVVEARYVFTTNQVTTWTVPADVYAINVKAWGGGGTSSGATGGFATATVAVMPGETLTVAVGQGGGSPSNTDQAKYGGGYTGLFRGGVSQANALVVAGGGGGSGGSGSVAPTAGGQALSSGTPLQGGTGIAGFYAGGGGGGGYWGGAGGNNRGGAGGSSYVPPWSGYTTLGLGSSTSDPDYSGSAGASGGPGRLVIKPRATGGLATLTLNEPGVPGAQMRMVTTSPTPEPWVDSGTEVTLLAGTYQVEFAPVLGYVYPSQSITVTAGESRSITAYTPSTDPISWGAGSTTPGASTEAGLYPWVVPQGVYSISVKAWGGGGTTTGASGGFANATLAVTPGETLTIAIGQGGGAPSSGSAKYGGGYTALFRGDVAQANALIVAGGGGGRGSTGAPSPTAGGQSLSSGTPLQGAKGIGGFYAGGGGGGGYWGGAGGNSAGGKGGSSYVLPGTGTTIVGLGTSTSDPDYAGSAGTQGVLGRIVIKALGVTPYNVAWASPSPIIYGVPLSGAQLNAAPEIDAAVVYAPAEGTVLGVGTRTLSAIITPQDTEVYSAKTVTTQITVSPAPMTVTADNKTRAYGVSNPALTWTATGFVNGESGSVFTGSPSLSSGTTATTSPGTYAISIARGTMNAANYDLTFVPGTLTITQATQVAPTTIAASATLIAIDTPVSLTVSGGGGQGNADLQYSTDSGANWTSMAMTDATHASFAPSQAGTYLLRAAWAGNTDYAASAYSGALKTLTVADNAVVITWAAPEPVTYGTALSGAQLNATTSVPSSLTYTPVSGTYPHAGVRTLSVTATPLDLVNYAPATASVELTVNPAVLQVRANSVTVQYGQAATLTHQYLDFVAGDNAVDLTGAPALATTYVPGDAPGTYPITVGQGTLTSPDYTFSLHEGTLTVTNASQSAPTAIAFTPASLIWGQSADFVVSGGGAQGPAVVEASLDGQTWSTTGVVMTDATHGTFTPPAVGQYRFRAKWDAQGYYNASAFNTVSTQLPVLGYGDLAVTLTGTTEGGWRVQGETEWRASGSTLAGLLAGNHTLEFKAVEGLEAPASQAVAVTAGSVTTRVFGYTNTAVASITNLPANAQYGVNWAPQLAGSSAFGLTGWTLEYLRPGADGNPDPALATTLSGTIEGSPTTATTPVSNLSLRKVGTWFFRVTYQTGNNVNPYREYLLTVAKADTTIEMETSNIDLGASIELSSVVRSNVNGGAIGTATYELVSGSGTLTNGSTLTATGTGTLRVRATYAGAANFQPSSAEFNFPVVAAPPSVVLTVSDANGALTDGATLAYGTALQVSSVATSALGDMTRHQLAMKTGPLGTMTLRDNQWGHFMEPLNSQSTDTIAKSVVAGVQTSPMEYALGTLTFTATATHPGTPASNTVTRSFTVVKATPTVSFTPVASTFSNRAISLAATVSNGDTGCTYTVVSGPGQVAGSTLTFTEAGTVTVQASYPGSTYYNPATAQATITVLPASAPVVTGSLSHEVRTYGQSVTITGQATEANNALTHLRVRRTDGQGNTVTVASRVYTGGAAEAFTDAPDAGSHTYAVEASNNSGLSWTASNVMSLTMEKAPTTIAWTPAATALNHSTLNLNARAVSSVTGATASSDVTFSSADVTVVPGSDAGQASVTFGNPGTVTIIANYAGSANYLPATSAAAIVVTANQAPAVAANLTGSALYGATMNLSLSATSADASITRLKFQVRTPDGVWQTPTIQNVAATAAITRAHAFTVTALGVHTFRASVSDITGEWFDAPELTATVAQAATHLTFTLPATGITNRTISLNGAVVSDVTQGRVATPTYTVVSGPGILYGTKLAFTAGGTVTVQAAFEGSEAYLASPTSLTRSVTVTANTLPVVAGLTLQPGYALGASPWVQCAATDVNGDLMALALQVNYNGTGWTTVHREVLDGRASADMQSQLTFARLGTYQVRAAATDDNVTWVNGAASEVSVGLEATQIALSGRTVGPGSSLYLQPRVLTSLGSPTGYTAAVAVTSGDATLQDTPAGKKLILGATLGEVVVHASYGGNSQYQASVADATFVVDSGAPVISAATDPSVGLGAPATGFVGVPVAVTVSGYHFPGLRDYTLVDVQPDGTSIPLTAVGIAASSRVFALVPQQAGVHTLQAQVTDMDPTSGTYGQSFTSGTAPLTVVKLATTVQFATTSGYYLGNAVILNATVKDERGSLVLSPSPTYTVVSGPGTVEGNLLTATGAGLIVVQASYAGDAAHNPAADVSQSIYVYRLGDPVPNLAITLGTRQLEENETPSSIVGTELPWVQLGTSNDTARVVVTATNVGGANLVISGVPSSSSNLTAVFGGGGLTLLPGESRTLTLTYRATRVQTEEPWIEVNSNDPSKPVFRVPIKVSAFFRIPGPGLPLDALYGATGFGEVAVGQTKALKLRHTNSGMGDLVIAGGTSSNARFAFGGARLTNTQGGTTDASFPVTVRAGESVELTVVFSPATPGYETASLTVQSNNPDGAAYTIPVDGTGR